MNDIIKEIVDIAETLPEDDQMLICAIARRLSAAPNTLEKQLEEEASVTEVSNKPERSVSWDDLAKRVKGVRK